MPCKNMRRAGMWLAIAVGIAVAAMSASEPQRAERISATADRSAAHVTLVLPLN